MSKITPQEEQLLAFLLEGWFNTVNFEKPNLFVKNRVAIILKRELKRKNLWQ